MQGMRRRGNVPVLLDLVDPSRGRRGLVEPMRIDLGTIYKRGIRGYFGECTYSSAISSTPSSSLLVAWIRSKTRPRWRKDETYAIPNSLLYNAVTLATCLNAIDPHGSSSPGTGWACWNFRSCHQLLHFSFFLLQSPSLRFPSLRFGLSFRPDSLHCTRDYEQEVDVHPHDLLYPTDPLLFYS